MTMKDLWTLQRLGFTRTHLGKGLRGERLWWKRTGTELYLVRQRDGATKFQDLDEGYRGRLPEDTPQDNRQWALDLANDDLTHWQQR